MKRKDPVIGFIWQFQPFSRTRVYVPHVSYSPVYLSTQGDFKKLSICFVATGGRTSNAKKEHIWAHAQIAPSAAFPFFLKVELTKVDTNQLTGLHAVASKLLDQINAWNIGEPRSAAYGSLARESRAFPPLRS
eukprot:1158746-Pelagomonas_calceolata.AAC.13